MLSWSNLSYSIRQDQATKSIIENVSGYAAPGEVLAIMGSSGAGTDISKKCYDITLSQAKHPFSMLWLVEFLKEIFLEEYSTMAAIEIPKHGRISWAMFSKKIYCMQTFQFMKR